MVHATYKSILFMPLSKVFHCRWIFGQNGLYNISSMEQLTTDGSLEEKGIYSRLSV